MPQALKTISDGNARSFPNGSIVGISIVFQTAPIRWWKDWSVYIQAQVLFFKEYFISPSWIFVKWNHKKKMFQFLQTVKRGQVFPLPPRMPRSIKRPAAKRCRTRECNEGGPVGKLIKRSSIFSGFCYFCGICSFWMFIMCFFSFKNLYLYLIL